MNEAATRLKMLGVRGLTDLTSLMGYCVLLAFNVNASGVGFRKAMRRWPFPFRRRDIVPQGQQPRHG